MVTLSCPTDPNHRLFRGPWGIVGGNLPVYASNGTLNELSISERLQAMANESITFVCTTCGEPARLEPNE